MNFLRKKCREYSKSYTKYILVSDFKSRKILSNSFKFFQILRKFFFKFFQSCLLLYTYTNCRFHTLYVLTFCCSSSNSIDHAQVCPHTSTPPHLHTPPYLLDSLRYTCTVHNLRYTCTVQNLRLPKHVEQPN